MTCKDCIHYGVCKSYIETALDGLDYSKLNMVADDCEDFKDRSRFVELPDDFPKGRLTTDEPTENFDSLMNYAYAKDGNAMLRYGAGKYDIDLAFYIFQESDEGICPANSKQDIIEGCCFECENECQLGILYFVAIQAAELRGRLKMYEDLAEQASKERDKDV